MNSVSPALKELVSLDDYEQSIVRMWREAGSVSNTGSGIASLSWDQLNTWANIFYKQDKIVFVPKRTKKTIIRTVRGKEKIETEIIEEQIPIHLQECSLEDYELNFIMQLSREYVQEYYEATDPQRECPKEIFLDEIDAEAESNAFLDFVKSAWGSGNNTPIVETTRK